MSTDSVGTSALVEELEDKRDDAQRHLDDLAKRRREVKTVMTKIAKSFETRGVKGDALKAIPNFKAAGGELDDLNEAIDNEKKVLAGLVERISELESDIERSGENNPVLQRIRRAQGLGDHGDNLETKHLPRRRGSAVAPLSFDVEQLRQVHKAIENRQSMAISARAFNTADSHLPAQLWPSVLGPMYESRLLEKLPGFATQLPSVRFVRHTGTTGSPAVVAEGALKPELTMTIDHVDAEVSKLAAHLGVSWEIISDWSNFFQYTQQTLLWQIIQEENRQLLVGVGNTTTTTELLGFTNTPGILTHATSTDTSLDSIEMSIAALRNGPQLAEPDIFVVNPLTWSAIRRSKDGQSRYLVAPDPTSDEAASVWGISALVTTQLPAGIGLLIDSSKFGRVHVRDPLKLIVGYAGDDLTRNITRLVAEERLTLAVERPGAVCKVTGLPTS